MKLKKIPMKEFKIPDYAVRYLQMSLLYIHQLLKTRLVLKFYDWRVSNRDDF